MTKDHGTNSIRCINVVKHYSPVPLRLRLKLFPEDYLAAARADWLQHQMTVFPDGKLFFIRLQKPGPGKSYGLRLLLNIWKMRCFTGL